MGPELSPVRSDIQWGYVALVALILALLICGCGAAWLSLFGWFFSDASVL